MVLFSSINIISLRKFIHLYFFFKIVFSDPKYNDLAIYLIKRGANINIIVGEHQYGK